MTTTLLPEAEVEACMQEEGMEEVQPAPKRVKRTRSRTAFILAVKKNKNKFETWQAQQNTLRVLHKAKAFLVKSRAAAMDFLYSFERSENPESELLEEHIGDIMVKTSTGSVGCAFASIAQIMNEDGLEDDPGCMGILRDECTSTHGPISHFPGNMETMAKHLRDGAKLMAKHTRNMEHFADLMESKAGLMRDAEFEMIVDPEDFDESVPEDLAELTAFYDDGNDEAKNDDEDAKSAYDGSTGDKKEDSDEEDDREDDSEEDDSEEDNE